MAAGTKYNLTPDFKPEELYRVETGVRKSGYGNSMSQISPRAQSYRYSLRFSQTPSPALPARLGTSL